MMRYRVIQRLDGSYQCQYHDTLWFWSDSTHESSFDLNDQISFAKRGTDEPIKLRKVKVVWP